MADLYNVNTTSIANSLTSILDLEIPPSLWFLLTLYLGLVVLMGLLGNLVVLYCSLVHGDLRLDSASLIFVHSMSVSDIFCVFLFFLPMFATVLFRKWVLGDLLCWVTGFFKSACVANELLTVLSMSGKLYSLTKINEYRMLELNDC